MGDDRIVANDDALRFDLGGEVTIAEVPGERRQVQGIATADFEKLFPFRPYLDQPTIIKDESIAVPEIGCRGKIEKKSQARVALHRKTATATIVIIERDPVGRRASPHSPSLNFLRPHDQNRKYRCAIGSCCAGSQVSNSPSARTS